jgi:hypothetical protein
MKKNTKGVLSGWSDLKPQFWIAVSNNRQKIYGTNGNLVYLDGEQEFQIELYNPTTSGYLAKIYLNDKLISNSGLVIKPGQRYYLDRYLDNDRKFLASMYSIEDTDEAKNATKDNGKVRVEFYPEITTLKINTGITYTPGMSTVTVWPPQGNYWGGFNSPNPYTVYSGTTNIGYSSANNLNNSGANSLNNCTYTTSSISGAGTINPASANTSYFNSVLINCDANVLNEAKSSKDLSETCRIEKGGKSDQTFISDNGQYSGIWTYSSEYTILPKSTKPIETSDIRRYCTKCGTKNKKTGWKFCPTCGESLG